MSLALDLERQVHRVLLEDVVFYSPVRIHIHRIFLQMLSLVMVNCANWDWSLPGDVDLVVLLVAWLVSGRRDGLSVQVRGIGLSVGSLVEVCMLTVSAVASVNVFYGSRRRVVMTPALFFADYVGHGNRLLGSTDVVLTHYRSKVIKMQ